MYLVDRDVELLCRMLDQDPEIALIRPAGPRRWKAQRHIPTLPDGQYMLWHIPSGPIQLESTEPRGKSKLVKDPFKGWTEIVRPFEKAVPWISASPLGNIRLSIRRRSADRRTIGRSDFHWVGNYYSIIGYRASAQTKRWWNWLRRRIAKLATQIPASGPITRKPGEIWAFPAALERIRKGAKRAVNP